MKNHFDSIEQVIGLV